MLQLQPPLSLAVPGWLEPRRIEHQEREKGFKYAGAGSLCVFKCGQTVLSWDWLALPQPRREGGLPAHRSCFAVAVAAVVLPVLLVLLLLLILLLVLVLLLVFICRASFWCSGAGGLCPSVARFVEEEGSSG